MSEQKTVSATPEFVARDICALARAATTQVEVMSVIDLVTDYMTRLANAEAAMRGIPDPAAFIARAKAIEEAARKAQDQLEYMRVLSSEEGEFYPNSSSECATRVAELTAALAMPGGAA